MREAPPEAEHYACGEEADHHADARVEHARLPEDEPKGDPQSHKREALTRWNQPWPNTRSRPHREPNETADGETEQESLVHGREFTPTQYSCLVAPTTGSRARAARTGLRPTRAELEAARGKSIPDLIATGLSVLFVGINPSLWSGAVGQHFARPGNRFWRALHEAGFTDRLLSPHEGQELLKREIGVTNLVNRATASADELNIADYRGGARGIERKVRRYRPKTVAFVGMGAYRVAFGRPRASGGRQEERLAGAVIWVLPNPSGRTAGYQMPALARAFRQLRRSL